MDYSLLRTSPAFAQPQPLRPYQYPSRYNESENPFGPRPVSVPASHILRSNNFPEQHANANHGQFDVHNSVNKYAEYASRPSLEGAESSSFMIPNPSMTTPSFMPSHPVVHYPHQQAMHPFVRMASYATQTQQPVLHRQPLRKRYTGGAGPFPCPKCGRYFRRRADMQRHQRKRNPCVSSDSKSEPARSPVPLPQLRERPNAAAYHNAGQRQYRNFLVPPKLDEDFRRQSE